MKDHRIGILERLRRLKGILGSEADRVLVVGASAPATYDLQPVQIRETMDVDLVVRASSYVEYAEAQAWLTGFGFAADVETDTVCSFVGQDLQLDLMPTPYEDLGFNRWYEGASCSAAIGRCGGSSQRAVIRCTGSSGTSCAS